MSLHHVYTRTIQTNVVGVREMRGKFSAYLARVAAGESFDIVSRGRARGYLSDRSTEILYSVASPWEMAIKIGQGKLEIDIADAIRSFNGAGFRRLDVEPAHLITLVALERLHGDPFDRMIVAQTICTGLTIMTTDSAILRYPVQTIACR